jgi:hypothetical protein
MDRRRRKPSHGYALLLALLATLGLLCNPGVVSAEPAAGLWSVPSTVAEGLVSAARPAVAHGADGSSHALWESQGQLFHAWRFKEGAWSTPRRIAAGVSPSAVMDGAGVLHVVFANQFLGNDEIYHMALLGGAWSLPKPISRTSGRSASPALAIGPNDSLLVAWADATPGYWTIYEGRFSNGFWTSRPVPSARGQAPSLVQTSGGDAYVAWQDRPIGPSEALAPYQVFLSQKRAGKWSPPVVVSDAPALDAVGPQITSTPDGFARLVWVENEKTVRYCFGQGGFWPEPVAVAEMPVLARGPRIAADANGVLHVAWDEGVAVWGTRAQTGAPSWPTPQIAASAVGNSRDVTLAPLHDGGATLTWVLASGTGKFSVLESRPAPPVTPRAWLPSAAND